MTLVFQSASIQTLYADLLQTVRTADLRRSIGNLAGTFVEKNIKGRTYFYLQYNSLGKKTQVYVGPDNKFQRELIKRFETEKQQIIPDVELCTKLCKMIVNGGGLVADNLSARVLGHLANGGLFKNHAVLVGSHAFVCYANMLGVIWKMGTHTHDIDLAYDNSLSVVLNEKIDLPSLIDHANMGFHPIPGLSPKHPVTSFKMRGKEIHLDILTPLVGPEKSGPVILHAWGVAAEPLRYLDYLIEDTEQTVVPFGAGILVTVPNPARYFWHKLIVMQERAQSFKTKIQKDRAQCEQLLEALIELRPHDLTEAWRALAKKNIKWQAYAKKGMAIVLAGESHSELKKKLGLLIL